MVCVFLVVMIMAVKKMYFNIVSVMDNDMVEYDTRTLFLVFS